MTPLPDHLNTGVDDLDEQHAHLLRWAEALVQDDPVGPPEERKRALAFLLYYTASHFAVEEAAMKAHAYPAYEAHRARHAVFRAAVAALRRDVESTGLDREAARRIYELVVEWLPRHVEAYDAPLALFLARSHVALTPLPEVEDLLEDGDLPTWMEEVIDRFAREDA